MALPAGLNPSQRLGRRRSVTCGPMNADAFDVVMASLDSPLVVVTAGADSEALEGERAGCLIGSTASRASVLSASADGSLRPITRRDGRTGPATPCSLKLQPVELAWDRPAHSRRDARTAQPDLDHTARCLACCDQHVICGGREGWLHAPLLAANREGWPAVFSTGHPRLIAPKPRSRCTCLGAQSHRTHLPEA